MSLGIIFALILSMIVAWFIISPLFEPALSRSDSSGESRSLGALLDSKERALRAIKDLELDFSMGKVSEEDFDQSKNVLMSEVATILETIKRSGGEGAGA